MLCLLGRVKEVLILFYTNIYWAGKGQNRVTIKSKRLGRQLSALKGTFRMETPFPTIHKTRNCQLHPSIVLYELSQEAFPTYKWLKMIRSVSRWNCSFLAMLWNWLKRFGRVYIIFYAQSTVHSRSQKRTNASTKAGFGSIKFTKGSSKVSPQFWSNLIWFVGPAELVAPVKKLLIILKTTLLMQSSISAHISLTLHENCHFSII